MPLTRQQKQLGTLPASRDMRYVAPGSLPAPCGHVPYDDLLEQYLAEVEDYRKDSASVARYRQVIGRAKTEHPQLVYEARVRGEKEPTDPVPAAEKKLGEAQRKLDVSEYTMVQTSDKLQDLRDDSQLKAHADGIWNEKLARVAVVAEELDGLLDDLGTALYLRTWLASHKPSKSVQGRAELTAFRRQIDRLKDAGTPNVFVSPKSMKKLQGGEDAEDIQGNPLPFDVADDLSKRGKLIVNPGKPLPRNGGLA